MLVGYGGRVRIGELATRTGVSTDTLRVWESRYGLLQPSRTRGGYRLYGPDDLRRVEAVLALREAGVPAGVAAARVLTAERNRTELPAPGDDGGSAGPVVDPAELVARFHAAAHAFDERAAVAVLDQAFASLSIERAVGQVMLPYLRELGDRWAAGTASVAEEHFGSGIVRRRLATLTHTWGVGTGPVAVLACPPTESHDIALLAFGVLLGRAGWRIRYLGVDTPLPDLVHACDVVQPDLVVLAATRETAFSAQLGSLARLGARHRIALGGQGATPRVAEEVGATVLPEDPVVAVGVAAGLIRSSAAPARS